MTDKTTNDIRINLENAIKALKITNACLNRVLDRMEVKPKLRVVK